jgi:hypothetical protein
MHASRLHTDPNTGITNIKPKPTPIPTTREQRNVTVTRRKRGTDTRQPRHGHPETRSNPRTRGAEETLLTWQGHNGRNEWNRGPKAKKNTSGNNVPGNAVRAIPTGPTGGTRPTTGNPVRTVTRAKWAALLERADRAGIDPTKVDLLERVMIAADSEHGRAKHTMKIRIDSITQNEWNRIDSIRLKKRTR